MWNGVLTIHVPKKGDAYLAGTVHVAKEVQTIQRYQLEPYMSEKRVKPESATVHVAKCFPATLIQGSTFIPDSRVSKKFGISVSADVVNNSIQLTNIFIPKRCQV